MATVTVMLGGAIMNAPAFSGSNFLFSKISGADEEHECHDRALVKFQADQAKRTQLIDWINEELLREGHTEQTFNDVNTAILEYSRVTCKTLEQFPLNQSDTIR